MDIAYSAVADIGVGAAALWAGLSAGVAYGLGVSATFITGGSSAIVIPTVSSAFIDSINPAEQYRQASTLSNRILDNEQVTLDSEDELTDFVGRLELVLKQLK